MLSAKRHLGNMSLSDGGEGHEQLGSSEHHGRGRLVWRRNVVKRRSMMNGGGEGRGGRGKGE